MTDALRDPAWQAVGSVLAFLGILVTVYLGLRAQKRKVLASRYDTADVLTLNPLLPEPVTVTFRGREVAALRLVRVTLVNTGTEPITRADFEAPLQFVLKEGTKVLSAEIELTNPETLRVQLETVQGADGYLSYIAIPPLLLNPTDGFRVKLLAAGHPTGPQIVARIAGISSLGFFDGDTERSGHRLLRATVFSLTTTLLVALLAPSPASVDRPWYVAIPSWLGFTLFMLVAAGAMFMLATRVTRRVDPYKVFR